jgi:hypothetical protein
MAMSLGVAKASAPRRRVRIIGDSRTASHWSPCGRWRRCRLRVGTKCIVTTTKRSSGEAETHVHARLEAMMPDLASPGRRSPMARGSVCCCRSGRCRRRGEFGWGICSPGWRRWCRRWRTGSLAGQVQQQTPPERRRPLRLLSLTVTPGRRAGCTQFPDGSGKDPRSASRFGTAVPEARRPRGRHGIRQRSMARVPVPSGHPARDPGEDRPSGHPPAQRHSRPAY